MINDDTIIELSITGRMQTLELPWSRVRDGYIIRFFLDISPVRVNQRLEEDGHWVGIADGITVSLKVKAAQ